MAILSCPAGRHAWGRFVERVLTSKVREEISRHNLDIRPLYDILSTSLQFCKTPRIWVFFGVFRTLVVLLNATENKVKSFIYIYLVKEWNVRVAHTNMYVDFGPPRGCLEAFFMT